MVLGDSRKERDIGVANGFTSRVFGKWEAFVSSPVMQILGLETGDNVRISVSEHS